jgi:HPt (histidine-containing phosphotransfer) domain-containing protein
VSPLIDARVLRDITALGRPALLSSLIDLYLQHSPALIGAIEAAARDRKKTELGEAIHTLKSSTASLGGTRLASLLKECEAMVNGGKIEEAALRLQRIRAEYRDFCGVLEQEKSSTAA